jgi:hypothetical protein
MMGNIQKEALDLFHVLHEAVGFHRQEPIGITPKKWLQLGRALQKDMDGCKSDSEFSALLNVKYGINIASAKAIGRLMHNEQKIQRLVDTGATARIGYSWIDRFVAASDNVTDKILELMSQGNFVNYKDIRRMITLATYHKTNSVRRRVNNRLVQTGLKSSKDRVTDAMLVAAQSVSDIVAEFNEKASGSLDKKGMMTTQQAAEFMEQQLNALKDRITVSSGGRSKVTIDAKAKTLEVKFQPLRKEHPMVVNLSINWGA